MNFKFTLLLALILSGFDGLSQAPPANDDYSAAVELTVNPGYVNTSFVSGTTVGATESPQEFCSNLSDYNGDVWFKFLATNTNLIINWSEITLGDGSGSPELSYEIFKTQNAAPGALILCRSTSAGFGSFVIPGLTSGETIFIRAYSKTPAARAKFKLSLLTPDSPPVNDNPSDAVLLSVNPNGDCATKASGNTLGATLTSSVPNNYGYDDVWYKFTATKAYHSINLSNFETVYGTSFGHWVNIYSNQAGAPGTRLVFNNTSNSVTIGDLVVGDTYFVQYNSLGNTNVTAMKFDICVNDILPPAYDEYGGATVIPVANTSYCANQVPLYTFGATASNPQSCNDGNDDDIWAKFTTFQGVQTLSLSTITRVAGTYPVIGVEVFEIQNDAPGSRVFCGTLTTLNGEVSSNLTNLAANTIYYIRFYTIGTQGRTAFNVCMSSPAKPANDEYGTATVLYPNVENTCNLTVPGNTNGASFSTVESCNTGDFADVWYRFTAQKISQVVRLNNLFGMAGAIYAKANIEVFTNVNNVPGSRVFCGEFQTFSTSTFDAVLSDLAVGANYYIRVYASGTSRPQVSFNICILPTNTPANDEAVNAIVLAVNTTDNCGESTPFTTMGATTSAALACHADNNDDVWFNFTATRTAHILSVPRLSSANGISTVRYVEVFSTLTADPGSRIFCASENFTETILSGLIIGKAYLVRVYTIGTNNRINFNICVRLLPKPVNDECVAAINISDAKQEIGTTESATESLPAGSCASGAVSDVWYKLTAARSGSFTVQASTVEFDLVLEAFSGSCGSLLSISCSNNGIGNETITISNAEQDNIYYFRVYSNAPANGRIAADAGAFAIQVFGSALPVTLTSFKAQPGENNAAMLEWNTTRETNSSHFDVEHSKEGKAWTSIGNVTAAGESADLKRYTFVHYTPSLGINYYRLRSVDMDGTYSVSQIRSVDLGDSRRIGSVYPNPASGTLYLQNIDYASIKSARLFNALGIQIPVKQTPLTGAFNIDGLSSGMYHFIIDYKNGSVENHKVLIFK